MTTPQHSEIHRKARELLAAEYERDGKTALAFLVRNGQTQAQSEACSVRAIEAALSLTPPAAAVQDVQTLAVAIVNAANEYENPRIPFRAGDRQQHKRQVKLLRDFAASLLSAAPQPIKSSSPEIPDNSIDTSQPQAEASVPKTDFEWALDQGGILADWCNMAAPALRDLMTAYERRVRSDCASQEQLDAQPWRCAEFVRAEQVLLSRPAWIVMMPQAEATQQPSDIWERRYRYLLTLIDAAKADGDGMLGVAFSAQAPVLSWGQRKDSEIADFLCMNAHSDQQPATCKPDLQVQDEALRDFTDDERGYFHFKPEAKPRPQCTRQPENCDYPRCRCPGVVEAKAGSDDAETLARKFHDTYERLAPKFGYDTRPDTKTFDPTTPNGRLMVAVCGELLVSMQPKPAEGGAAARGFAHDLNVFLNRYRAHLPQEARAESYSLANRANAITLEPVPVESLGRDAEGVEALLASENPERKDFTVDEALKIADMHDNAHKHVPSVSRTLAAEVRRLTTSDARPVPVVDDEMVKRAIRAQGWEIWTNAAEESMRAALTAALNPEKANAR